MFYLSYKSWTEAYKKGEHETKQLTRNHELRRSDGAGIKRFVCLSTLSPARYLRQTKPSLTFWSTTDWRH